MLWLNYILLLFFFIAFSTVNTDSIEEDSTAELLLQNRFNGNKKLSNMITSYRHRFEHSPNFKALRWAVNQQSNLAYCDFCHLFVPVVSLMYS